MEQSECEWNIKQMQRWPYLYQQPVVKTMPTCRVGTVTPTTGPRQRRTEPGLLERILRFQACRPQLEALEVGNPKPSSMPVSMEPCKEKEYMRCP